MAEASPLAEKISKNFLQCAICFETHRDPRALPCQHGFCRDCLERYVESSEDKRTLVCPSCRKVVKLSKEGVRSLPLHFLVSSLKDIVDMETIVPNVTCSNCNTSGKQEVKVRCLDCMGYLCDTCYAAHKILKAMKDHKVVAMEEIIAGKVSLMDIENKMYCDVHKKLLEYFCETEKKVVCRDCVILKTCPIEHRHITSDEVAKNQLHAIEDLGRKCDDTKKKFQNALKEHEKIEKGLKIAKTQVGAAMDKVRDNYVRQLDDILKRQKADLEIVADRRIKQITSSKADLENALVKLEKAREEGFSVTKAGSKYEIISRFPSLSNSLKELSGLNPALPNNALSYIKFEAMPSMIPSLGQVSLGKDETPEKKWKLTGQFSTGNFNRLHGIAINEEDNIAVSSWENGVALFTRSGMVKLTFKGSYHNVVDISISQDGSYITAIPDTLKGMQIFDIRGNRLTSIPVRNIDNGLSNINGITIDSKDRVVVGQVRNTISIHHTNGSLISKFATQFRPLRLAVTSNGEIVCSVMDDRYKEGAAVYMMDYSGCNVRLIKQLAEVTKWSPSFLCCGQGEIFVVNSATGKPTGVYRFTAEGNYLSCVTTDVSVPSGIELSRDGMELFVAETVNNVIKIFQRS